MVWRCGRPAAIRGWRARQGIDTKAATYVGMAISNGLVALAGALFAQMNGFAGRDHRHRHHRRRPRRGHPREAIFGARSLPVWILGCIAGSALPLAVALALNASFPGLSASDLNLVTAVLVVVALILPGARIRCAP